MFESIRSFWSDINEIREARMVVWITILAIVLAVSIYAIKTIRDWLLGSHQPTTSDHLTRFRELREQGKINDEEFTRLRSTVGQAAEFLVKSSESQPSGDRQRHPGSDAMDPIEFRQVEQKNTTTPQESPRPE